MSSTYSTSLRIELQATGANSGTWGTITNNNFSQSLEFAIAGVVNVACGDAAVTTLTNGDGPQSQANNQARNAHIRLTGAHGAVRIAQFPATQKIYLITNATTDSGSSGPYAMTIRLGASGNTLSIANGATRLVATDGTNWYDVFASGGQFGGSFLADGTVDVNGKELVLDADADTSLTADTDDQIDVKIANIDVAELTTQNSGDLVITTAVQDKDFVIKGDDGGSGITALTIDMSDAGAAAFNSTVTATQGIFTAGAQVKNGATSAGFIEFFEDSDNGTNKATLIGPAATADVTITMPAQTGTMVVSNSTAGNDVRLDSFGVGTDASGTTGEIRATNDVTAFYSSDVSLKENIVNIPSPMDLVSQLNGVLFDWKKDYIDQRGGEDGYFVRKKDVGVLAQDVEKVLPEIVGTRSDGVKAVKYDRLTSLLIECVKDLQGQIDKLKRS
jgi:hypothetical protein